jgi:Aldehyde dehydrogenase family
MWDLTPLSTPCPPQIYNNNNYYNYNNKTTIVEAFAKTLPPGAMNFVSGRGRDTMPYLMKTGDIDALAFIGGSKAADDLIRQHPQPHRLKVFLQLEAKNMGVCLVWTLNCVVLSCFVLVASLTQTLSIPTLCPL